MACPLRVQWLDYHQFRGPACLFRQALALLLGKLRRHPMCPICASIAGFPLRLKRSVPRCGVRATYPVGLGDNSLAVAQDRNSRMASEMRGGLSWTTSSRQSICPQRQRSTARGSSHPIPTSTSMAHTKCRAASAASAALATRSASGTRFFRLILSSNSLFGTVQGQHYPPPSADTCSRSCRRCFARRS